MRLFSGLVAVALAVAVSSSAIRADDTGKKKAKGHPIRGTVVKVTPGAGGAADSFTIKVAAKKSKGAEGAKDAPVEERTFQVTKDTQFETLGKKKAVSAAAFADLKPGVRVIVTADANTAQKVQIVARGKKAK